jgi:hypothetical protein
LKESALLAGETCSSGEELIEAGSSPDLPLA